MDTIDIYAMSNKAETAEEMEQLSAQIRVERHVIANDRLGIPRMRITNGPVGVGMGDGTPSPPATALPMTIGVAASFDPELAREAISSAASACTSASTCWRAPACACTACPSAGATSSTSRRIRTSPA